MKKQQTIRKEISFEGTGLHTANRAKVVFKPAPENSGLTFVRTDLEGKPAIKAEINNLLPESRRIRRTSIGRGEAEIHTVEHVLATVLGLGITNLAVEINNNEFPGSDGSSRELARLLLSAEIVEQEKEARSPNLKEPIFVESDGSQIIALPDTRFRVSYTLDYPPPLNSQFASFEVTPENFLENIAPARTFCLQSEVENLVAEGLGKGSNYENTIVIGEEGVINNTTRFENEMARHKILDLLGDLFFLGGIPRMHVIAIRGGHNLNIRLVNRILETSRREQAAAVIPPDVIFDYEKEAMEAEDVIKVIPHRPPFLFVDRILRIENDNFIVGLKNVAMSEPYFAGHFPGHPVMPGVILVETMAQVAGVLMLRKQENRSKVAYFAAIDNVRFRSAVLPGDQLIIEVELKKVRSRVGQVHARALVANKVAAEADLMFALVDR